MSDDVSLCEDCGRRDGEYVEWFDGYLCDVCLYDYADPVGEDEEAA